MKKVFGVISTLFILASPWVLYWTLTHQDVTAAAFTLLGWVVIRTIPIVLTAERAQRRAALTLPAIGLVFALLGLVSDNAIFLLALPSATQAAFGLTFLRSLAGTPMIEHFARMIDPHLGPPQVAHCRQWTKVWGVYLIVLAAIGPVLAATSSLRVWTFYVGIGTYLLIGLLFAVEYVVRKVSFREYTRRNPIDWVLRKLAPPRPTPEPR